MKNIWNQDPGEGEESFENRSNQDRPRTANSQPPSLSEQHSRQAEQQAHNLENASDNPIATSTSASLDFTLDGSAPSAQDNPQTNSSFRPFSEDKSHTDTDNDDKAKTSSASLDFTLERQENAAEQSSYLAQRSSSPSSSADRPTLDFVAAASDDPPATRSVAATVTARTEPGEKLPSP